MFFSRSHRVLADFSRTATRFLVCIMPTNQPTAYMNQPRQAGRQGGSKSRLFMQPHVHSHFFLFFPFPLVEFQLEEEATEKQTFKGFGLKSQANRARSQEARKHQLILIWARHAVSYSSEFRPVPFRNIAQWSKMEETCIRFFIKENETGRRQWEHVASRHRKTKRWG